MKKLLYITNAINGAGGLERVLSIKTSYLADRLGYEVHILKLNEHSANSFYEFSEEIKFHNITVSGNPIKYFYQYRSGLSKKIREINPDVISVCDDGFKAFFLPYILGNKIPLIYERHASLYHSDNPSWMRSLMRKLARNFDQFVVLTKGNQEEWNNKNTVVIPNPLSFYPDEVNLLENKTAIAVGSHSKIKGYDLLLEAWEMVNKNFPDWKLKIFGKIDDQKTFIKLSEEKNLQNSVEFHQPVKNISKEYLNASIMVLSSRTEGFGMVLIEAMSCGLPCISFDCPSGPKDIITKNEDGFLVENGNVNLLAEALMKLVGNGDLRKKMGNKAKENVKRYLSENVITKWDALFNLLVEK